MNRLSIVLTLVTGSVLVGGLVIGVLSFGLYNWQPIAIAVGVGLLLTWPVAYVISRRIKRRDPGWELKSGKPTAPDADQTDYPET